MTNQEAVALGVATVVLVTNCLGAAFTIKRVYAKRAQPNTVFTYEDKGGRKIILVYCMQTMGRNPFERFLFRVFLTTLVWLVMAIDHFIPLFGLDERSSKRAKRE
jgi:hypothetical protein